MIRKLVFHFYLSKDWKNNPIYEIHFNCLEYYKNKFDEAYFAICPEESTDLESIKEVKQKLVTIFNHLNKLEFETVENTIFRECTTLKKQVVDRLGEDDLVFFAHTKGVSNINYLGFEMTKKWVYSLYFFSLNDMCYFDCKGSQIENLLNADPFMLSYGPLLLQLEYEPHILNKYEWYYSGTFF